METIFLWPNEMPNGNNVKRKSLQEIDTINNVTEVTEVTDPSIVVFKPAESIDNGIGILICPGGSYTILAIDLEGHEIAQWLNKLGYAAYVIQYRVPNNRKGALNDLQRAIKIIRGNTKLNHSQLGILGFSAGGNLCARASVSPAIESYVKVDEMDSISSRPDFSLLIYPAYLDEGMHNSLSTDLSFDKNTPPMFVFGTEDDPYFNSSKTLAEALEKSKVPFEFHTLQKGGHGYGLRQGNKAAETWPILAEAWLNKIKANHHNDVLKKYTVKQIAHKQLAITGSGDHTLWNKADKLLDFSSPWDSEKVKPIEFKALCDTETLFFCFKVEDAEIHIDTTDNSIKSINESDRVELFFRPNELMDPYYCLEIDTASRIMDFKARPNKQFDFNWNWPSDHIEVKSSIETNHFTVEIAISLASLTKLGLLKGGKIETGIYRAKYNMQENGNFEPTWITWVNPNTEISNFHTPSSFGILHLENQ